MATKQPIAPALGLFAPVLLGVGLLSSCETTDPCALRQAACLDVVMQGNRNDGMGNPIAYRGLTIKVCSPAIDPSADPNAKCTPAVSCGAGTELASSAMPFDLTAVADYSANVQGLMKFQLPDSFNAIKDVPPGSIVDLIDDVNAKIAKLKQLRATDPRAVRILVLQAGLTLPVWDSRCDEDLFSADQWTMLKYYRVGQNEYRSVYTTLTGAKTSAP